MKLSENGECFFLKEGENLSCYYPPPPTPHSKKVWLSIMDYLHSLWPLNFCGKKSGHFFCTKNFLGKFQAPPQTKI